MNNRNRKLKKISRVVTAWETLAPTATFGGMTLVQFKARVQALQAQREKLSELGSLWVEAQEQEGLVLEETHAATLLAVNAVKGNAAHGEDSPLYAAMGYVCKSNRKSGLTRRKAVSTAPAQ
jgi:hypothetical protein